ncbi:hypothetical protein SteCoe_9007 [Stentor coeruleus]|uniref:Casein kinase I n=1 Tax=Stentor coeruleus TaxID=5963 RepID=A0A1R2CIS6_9CILI|nr:hypothetical protein SteCoe_9007 [Stentor coeruleus]
MQNLLLDNRYKVQKKLNESSISYIYKAYDQKTGNKVVIKYEKNPVGSYLQKEVRLLNDFYSVPGFIQVLSQGSFRGKNFAVYNYLGKSLQTKLVESNGRFSLACVLKISEEVLDKIHKFHTIGYVHNRISPKNILTGYELDWQSLFIVSFAYSSVFMDFDRKRHVAIKKNALKDKNTLYSSVNIDEGYTSSRRDDLESFIYMLIHFLQGYLPWDPSKTDENVYKIKKNISVNELCQNCPIEFKTILQYIKNLKFNEDPDYEMLKNTFKTIAEKNGIHPTYDWKLNNDKMIAKVKYDKSQTFLIQKLMQSPELLSSSVHRRRASKTGKFTFELLNSERLEIISTSRNRLESQKELSRVDTVKLIEYPEINNRKKLLELRKEFINEARSSSCSLRN